MSAPNSQNLAAAMPFPVDENRNPTVQVRNPYINTKPKAANVGTYDNSSRCVATKEAAIAMPLEQQEAAGETEVAAKPLQNSEQLNPEPPTRNDPATQLLETLQRDYEELNKQSAKACLRSKHLLCPEVKSALKKANEINLTILKSACQMILEDDDYLGSLRHSAKTKSSLWYMTRIGACIRLIQFLLCWKQNASETTAMIGGLIQSISGSVLEALKQCENQDTKQGEEEGEDANDVYSEQVSESFHAPQVACFTFAFLLRIKSLFMEHRPDLLSGLWKFLDPLAQALVPKLPNELLQDAIQALSGYLKEFILPAIRNATSLTYDQQDQQQQTALSIPPQQLKLCSFFFARLANFLKIGSSFLKLDQDVMQDVMTLLLTFRGFAIASQETCQLHSNTSPALEGIRKIANKADQCLGSLLTTHHKENEKGTDSECTSVLPNNSHIKILLSLDETDVVASDDTCQALAKASFWMGKVQTLVQLLKDHAVLPSLAHSGNDTSPVPPALKEETNVDILLVVVQHLIFVGLPHCHDLLVSRFVNHCTNNDRPSTMAHLLEDVLATMATFLYYCETQAPCMTTNADRGSASLHRLLVRWLMPMDTDTHCKSQLHPLTQQFFLALIQMHAANMYDVSGDAPVLSLLVKLFFDARTLPQLRSSIAGLFRAIFESHTLPRLARELQRLIGAEYSSSRPFDDKKRKRNSKKESREEGKRRTKKGRNPYSPEDALVICSVLSYLPVSSMVNASHNLEKFSLGVISLSGKPKRRRMSKRLTATALKKAIFCLALIEGSVRHDQSLESLKSIAGGKDLFVLLEQTISWFLCHWEAEFDGGKRRHAHEDRIRKVAILGTALLRLIAFSCEQSAEKEIRMDHEQVRKVYQLVDACTDQKRILNLYTAEESNYSSSSSSEVILGVSHVLRIVGRVVPLEPLEDVFLGFFGLFERLLSANICWSLSAYTIGSLHAFSVTTPRAFKAQLLNCIPKRRRKALMSLLQCRIQGAVYNYEHYKRKDSANRAVIETYGDAHALQTYCSTKLESLIDGASIIRNSKSSLSHSVLSIHLGSYFMTMPTIEGRKAVVIFPPGDTSLKDIEYMLGGVGNEDGEEASSGDGRGPKRLRRILVAKDGSGKVVLDS